LARRILRLLPAFLFNNRLTIWGKERDLPEMPAKSFRAQYRKYQKEKRKQELSSRRAIGRTS
jgi:L-lactate dehydrogenase complex protein LldF